MAIKLVRRTAWGAPATSAAAYIASTKGVKVHYLGSAYTSRAHSKCDDTVRSIRASHLANKAEGYSDIAYNMLVCEHGYVYEGRGAHKKTGANGNSSLNSGHYAVCALLGSSGLTKPSDAMLSGIRDAIEWLRKNGDAGNEIKGHRDGYATTCPGSALYAWVKKGAPRPGGTTTPAPPKPAGIVSALVPKSRESKATMTGQRDRALKDWPFIPAVEKKYGLPACMLLAVGSRETNLANKVGDKGHGHGVWQQDDRWWTLPAGFDQDVRAQAEKAADMLADNYTALKDWGHAASAYNRGVTGVRTALAAGLSADAPTAGGDYGADVLGRMAHMGGATTTAPKPPATSGSYTVKAGDTLTSIGKALGVAWKTIASANKLVAPYVIKAGQKLKVPGKTTPAPAKPKPSVDLSKLVLAARNDPPKTGTPVTYSGSKTVEKALQAEGLLSSKYVDGHFGTQTKTAYAAWQRRLGYSGKDADGIPGSTSLKKLGSKHGFNIVA